MKKAWPGLVFVVLLALTVPVYADSTAENILKAVVKVRAIIPKEARTASILGTEREGIGDFYRKIWATGDTGVDVSLSILRGIRIREITVHSVDRYQFLLMKPRKAT